MQSISISWPVVWGLLAAGLLLGGLAVLLKGLYPKPIGTAPHCPKCGYNLTGSVSDICPECGVARRETACRRCGQKFGDAVAEVCPQCGGPRVMDTAVYGEYRRSRGLIALAGILVLLGLTSAGVLYRSMPRQVVWVGPHVVSVSNNVHNVKFLLADLRQRFAAGRVDHRIDGRELAPDARISFLVLMIKDRLPYKIRRSVDDTTVHQAAMAQLTAAGQLIETQFVPAYNQALQSGMPDDAKALVPLVDQLDKHLDALLKIVRGS